MTSSRTSQTARPELRDEVLAHFRPLDEHVARPATAGLWHRMSSESGAFVDRIALRAMERLFMSGRRTNYKKDMRGQLDHLAAVYAAPEALKDPSLFFGPVPLTAVARQRLGRLAGGERSVLTYASGYRTWDPDFQQVYSSYAANERNRVHLWQHDTPGRPTVLCLHPWCGGVLGVEERIFAASRLYRLGFDVALFTLPFHGSRTPRQARFSGQLFPSRDMRRTNEGMRQAIGDLRRLMQELRAAGCGPIGVVGISLGGYVAAVLAGLEAELAFVVTIVAPCSVADLLWSHGAGRPARAEAEQAGVTLDQLRFILAVHCPLLRPLALPPQRVLMIHGEGDRIVPDAHHRALWEHWGRPQAVSFAGGHLLQVGRSSYLRQLQAFLRGWQASQ